MTVRVANYTVTVRESGKADRSVTVKNESSAGTAAMHGILDLGLAYNNDRDPDKSFVIVVTPIEGSEQTLSDGEYTERMKAGKRWPEGDE